MGDEFDVVGGGFFIAPQPCDDVGKACGDEQALFVEVGAVDK